MNSTPADFFSFVGSLSRFGVKSLVSAVTPPYEWQYFLIQIEDVGWRSLPLIAAAGKFRADACTHSSGDE
jgi:hypothetical protein